MPSSTRSPPWRVPRSVADLPGGLTNRNLRVTTSAGDYVVRLTQSDAGLLGIDRDAEHANTRAAAEAGVGAEVVDYRPDLGLMVITFLPGTALTERDDRARPACSRAPLPRSGGCRLGRGSSTTSTCSPDRRGTSPSSASTASTLPAGYDDFAPQWEHVRRALAATRRPTVPCNNDLLAGNFIDEGDRIWLIDYEYSGNNDPAFELGNAATECDLTREQTDELVAAWPGGEDDPAFRARVDLQSLCSQYGWALWGFIQAATSPLDFDFHAWGMERFEKAARRFTSDGFDGLLDRAGGPVVEEGALAPVDETSGSRADLPTRARVVIIGGGVIGCSTAYHLAKLGWTDVVLLEQGTLSCGTTWHAAGLVGLLRASESGTRLAQYSAELYAGLEAETGLSTGYRQCGGLIVARTEDRMVQLRRTAATAAAFDLDCAMLTPAEAQDRWPAMRSTTSSARSGSPATAAPTPPT